MKKISALILILLFTCKAFSVELNLDLLKRTRQIKLPLNGDIVLVCDLNDSNKCNGLQLLIFNKKFELIDLKNFASERIDGITDSTISAYKKNPSNFTSKDKRIIDNEHYIAKYKINYLEDKKKGILFNRSRILDSIIINENSIYGKAYCRKKSLEYKESSEYHISEQTKIEQIEKDLMIKDTISIEIDYLEWYPDILNGVFGEINKEFNMEFQVYYVPRTKDIVDKYFNDLLNFLKTR